jgi:adenylate cyclase
MTTTADEKSFVKRLWQALVESRTARTAIAGAVAGWVLIQVAATVVDPLDLPVWSVKATIITVAIGFALAVAIAGGLDIAHGKPVRSAAKSAIPEIAADPSVAVLAFADMSPGKDQDYFCEGAAEEIINALLGVGGLRVASRSGSFQFKNRSVDNREIGRLLNVRTILDGSVRKAGDRLRVAAQLVNASDGAHLWSQTFDRKIEDIFSIQEDIARSIVQALRVTLLDADAANLQRRGTANPAAYDFFLRGRQLMAREKDVEQRSAIELFRKACALDPDFALGHAALASGLAPLAFRRADFQRAVLDEGMRASQRALQLAPELAEAHLAHAQILQLLKRLDEAAAEFKRAIELNPRLFDAHYYYARFCVARGDHAGAVKHYEKAFEIQPDDYRPVTLAIQEYQAIGDQEGQDGAIRRSWTAIERRLAIDPDDSAARDHGAGVLALLGRREESISFCERAIALRPEDGGTHYNAACCMALLGENDRALDLLERAVQLGHGNVDWYRNDNDLVPLHGNPRFQAILRKLETDRR